MKKLIILGLIISTVAFSATKDNLNRFKAGDAASASDVMENFDDLADAIDTNTASIANKADQSSVNTNTSDISANTTAIASKADESDLDSKADTAYVDGKISDVNTTLTSIQTELSNKVDVSSNTVYWQIKTLTNELSSSVSVISELTFDNLEVGKTYRLTMSAYFITSNNGWGRFIANHDGDIMCYIMFTSRSSTNEYAVLDKSFVFKAKSSSLKFEFLENSAETTIINAGENQTYAILEELPYHIQTTKF